STVPIYFAILRCPSKGASAAPSEPPPRDRWRRQSRRSYSGSPTGSRSSAIIDPQHAAWHVDRGRDDARDRVRSGRLPPRASSGLYLGTATSAHTFYTQTSIIPT